MKFVCLGFIDEAKFAGVPQDEGQRMMDDCLAYDQELRRDGHYLGGQPLDSAKNAKTLRMANGKLAITDGPFTETKETLGGILLLEARDMNHAVELMSKHPGAKIGPWEIRPVNEAVNDLIATRLAMADKRA